MIDSSTITPAITGFVSNTFHSIKSIFSSIGSAYPANPLIPQLIVLGAVVYLLRDKLQDYTWYVIVIGALFIFMSSGGTI